MNHIFKSILATLICILTLYSSFGQTEIELSLDPATGELKDPGTTDLYRCDYVVWKIKAGEDIRWFRIQGWRHPFAHLPSSGNFTTLRADARKDAIDGDWKYTIMYRKRSTNDPQTPLDPIISIKPTPSFTWLIILISILIGTAFGFPLGIRKEKNRNIRKNTSI